MERDFLGMNVKEEEKNQEEPKESDFRAFFLKESMDSRCNNSAFTGSYQWPFFNKAQLQQFMSIKGGAQGERPKKIGYYPLATSGSLGISTADAFQANHRFSTTTKKSFTLDVNGPQLGQANHFGLPCSTYPVQAVDQGASMSRHPPELRAIPVSSHPITTSMSSPYYKIHGTTASASATTFTSMKPYGGIPALAHRPGMPIVGSVSPSSNSRSIPAVPLKPTPTAQLTIFYAGSVNVYENVPLEKAEAIMFLAGQQASSAGSTQINLGNLVLSPRVKPITDGFHVKTMISTGSVLSNPISGTTQLQPSAGHSGIQSAGGSTSTDEVMVVKTISPLACKTQPDSSKMTALALAAPLVPTVAIPQARKASLTRFLEMRKERVASASPYAKPPEACKEKNNSSVIRNTLAKTAGE